jgi:hypothetical protein
MPETFVHRGAVPPGPCADLFVMLTVGQQPRAKRPSPDAARERDVGFAGGWWTGCAGDAPRWSAGRREGRADACGNGSGEKIPTR